MLNFFSNPLDFSESPNLTEKSEESLKIGGKLPRTLSITPPPQESYRVSNLPRIISELDLEPNPSPIRSNADGIRISKAHMLGAKTFKNTERKKTTLVDKN